MGNVVIATPVLSDASVLTASSANSSFPVSNLLDMQLSQVWRSTSTTASLTLNLGSTQSLNFFALLGGNATATATVRIRTANSEANLTASPSYDSTAQSFYTGVQYAKKNFIWFVPSASISNSWVLIDIVDTSNAAGYIELGRVYVANAWQPTKNIVFDWSLSWRDDSPRFKTLGNNTFVTAKPRYRVLECSLEYLTEFEMYTNAFEIDRTRGSSSDILVLVDPDAAATRRNQWTVYGTMSELTPITNPAFNIFTKRYIVEEIL